MQRSAKGFTLVELLVAISLMALMAILSWRGLDGISRSQQRLQQHADEVLTLQATLTQWGTDLDALVSQPGVPGLDWDGRTLRIVRRSSAAPGEGLVVVAWARRSNGDGEGQWLRWQSTPLADRSQLDQAWQQAAVWAQTPRAEDRLREVRTVPIDQWQVFYYRNNAWTNPLSSADTADANAAVPNTATGTTALALPDGVRLVLTLSPGQAVSGVLTRDWVSPLIGGGR
ncbi:MAG: general secretion pathway protein J [Rhodoferax ferrireducens]|uniref:General secretion pathway protein J n=1 Tax=Rhodoferax ferrireducens TaxID=192843 RepID=A0A1W9KQJ5_9BURK|nr:MAG: general secretion pathway protein J [Rhodoferax ferrireducens]